MPRSHSLPSGLVRTTNSDGSIFQSLHGMSSNRLCSNETNNNQVGLTFKLQAWARSGDTVSVHSLPPARMPSSGSTHVTARDCWALCGPCDCRAAWQSAAVN